MCIFCTKVKSPISMKVQEATTKPFKFKKFTINQDKCTMKIGTDGVLLGAWADLSGARKILDVGTGTGVIAVMLGQRSPEATIHAVEIHKDSFEQAKENFAQSPWAERLQVFHTSVQDFADEHPESYDLIVSNPPFFTGGTFSHNHNRTNVRHAVKLPHGDLLHAVRDLLTPKGKFCVVLPLIEGLRFQERAGNYNLYCNKLTEVRPKSGKPVERLLLQFEREEKSKVKNTLTIQKSKQNDWTKQYTDLTGDFYLNM